MAHFRSSMQGNVYNHQVRLGDRNVQALQPFQQAVRGGMPATAAAPRSIVSPNWRASTGADLSSWMSPSLTNYTLSSQSRTRGENLVGMLDSYAYCLDRGNGQVTRLIPADMLPPMHEVPARQAGAGGMVVLPVLHVAPPQGVANMNQPVTMKVRPHGEGEGTFEKRRLSAQASSQELGQVPNALQVTSRSSPLSLYSQLRLVKF